MSTNLSGNTLTLNNTVLNEETLKAINSYYHAPNNCKAGDTVILDGIECLCIATGVTIQGSNLTRIAIDKNYDLGHYQRYVGMNLNGTVISQIRWWRWGGYGTELGNTSIEVGYGLQNTINCLARKVNYTKGNYKDTQDDGCPWLWTGVNDFRSSHSDKWFLPSIMELVNYVYPYVSHLSFDTTTGATSSDYYWSSSENSAYSSCCKGLYNSASNDISNKFRKQAVRLCRAF